MPSVVGNLQLFTPPQQPSSQFSFLEIVLYGFFFLHKSIQFDHQIDKKFYYRVDNGHVEEASRQCFSHCIVPMHTIHTNIKRGGRKNTFLRTQMDPRDRAAQLSTSFTAIILSLMTPIFLRTYLCIHDYSFLLFFHLLLLSMQRSTPTFYDVRT